MSPEALETVAGRYVLEEPIARGGMATVWKARDEVLARSVALKILNPELAENPSFLERFRTEALAAARLAHPNVVQTYDTGTDEAGNHFIVMELCGGGTLEDVLRREGTLEPQRAVAIGGHICDALAYAHRNGVVHRDVKPGNVLIGSDGSIKVADFGIAKAAFARGDVTTTGQILGTVTYVSPEQARGEEPDGRSDIYSLGVVIYELLTGRPPFAADSAVATAMQHIQEPAASPRTVRGGIPRALDAVVMRALAKDPGERFATADAFKRALEDACAPAAPVMTGRVPPVETPDEPEEPGIGRIVALIVAVILLALVVAYVAGEERGGNGGGSRQAGGGAGNVIGDVVAHDFDPYGGDGEHPEEAGLAIDGDAATAWTTQDYDDALSLIGKPGVGLLVDAGRPVSPATVEIVLQPAGADIELRAGDDAATSEEDLDLVDRAEDAGATLRFETDGASARYWLVWITGLPGDGGGTAGIAEVRFLR